jgi:transcriptional regulator with XRE-family HTH domain
MESIQIGKRLKKIRGGISQKEFSSKLGVSQATIARYENGSRSPDADFIQLLVVHYGIEPMWFITGEGPMYRGVPEIGAAFSEVDKMMGATQREFEARTKETMAIINKPGEIFREMAQKNLVLEDDEEDEFDPAAMDPDEFWSSFHAWMNEYPAMRGYAQVEICDKLPKFVDFLKKRWLLARQNRQDELRQSRAMGDDAA